MKQLKNYNKPPHQIFLSIILLLVFSAANAGIIEDFKQQIYEKETKIKELEAQAENYKKNIKTTKSKQITLKNQIKEIGEDLAELNFNVDITQTKIDKQILEIKELNLEIEKKIQEIQERKNNLKELLRILQKEDSQDIVIFILRNENLSKFLNQIQHLEDLQGKIQEKLNEVKKSKVDLENKRSLEEKEKLNLEDLKNNLVAQKKIADLQKINKINLLRQSKNQEQIFQKLLTEVQKKRQEIQKEIFDLEEKLRFTIDPNTIPLPRSDLLSWPSEGLLSQKYGLTTETGFLNHAYQFHNGIDIAASLGTPIKSAKEGIVKAAGDNGNYAYGKWVVVDHKNGLTTLYAHLSLISVGSGQVVKTGDIIGYMGTTGFSTGPHLHFTVYATNTFLIRERWFGLLPLGGSLDPLKYL